MDYTKDDILRWKRVATGGETESAEYRKAMLEHSRMILDMRAMLSAGEKALDELVKIPPRFHNPKLISDVGHYYLGNYYMRESLASVAAIFPIDREQDQAP
jgi:hypothetical protein